MNKLQVPITEEELWQYKEEAAKVHMTLAAWVRCQLEWATNTGSMTPQRIAEAKETTAKIIAKRAKEKEMAKTKALTGFGPA